MEIKAKTRKVQKVGFSLYISIPEVWSYTHGIEKGDRIATSILPDGRLAYQKIEEKRK